MLYLKRYICLLRRRGSPGFKYWNKDTFEFSSDYYCVFLRSILQHGVQKWSGLTNIDLFIDTPRRGLLK